MKAFKLQASSQSLEPGCGLSVSLGVRGDSSSPHKAALMPSSSSWTSSPFPLHLKSQIVCTLVHHGPSVCTLQTPSAVGMLCLSLCRGRCCCAGACWAPYLHSPRNSSSGEAPAGPQVQRMFALSAHCQKCGWMTALLVVKEVKGGCPRLSVTQVDDCNSALAVVNHAPLEFLGIISEACCARRMKG